MDTNPKTPTVLDANPSKTSKRKASEPKVVDDTVSAAKRVKTRPARGFIDDENINGDGRIPW